MELLEIIKHPRSRAYQEIKEWLSSQFDPDDFDLDSVNQELKLLEDEKT